MDLSSIIGRTRSLAPSQRCSAGRISLRSASLQLLVCGGLMLGSGCTPWREYIRNGFKVGPNFRAPPAPVATQWIDAADSRMHPLPENSQRWWTVFNDPVLDSLVDTASRQNLNLRVAAFRVLQSRAQLGFARGNFFPQTQTMNGDAYREALSRNSANRSFVGTRFYNQFDYGFNLAWELDFWGRLRRLIEAAEENVNVTVEDYDAILVTLLGDVANNYVQSRTMEAQINYTRANVELQRKTLVLADARFKAGGTSDLDVEQARTVLAQTEAQIPVLEITQTQANNQICILMSIPPEDLKARLGSGDIPNASPNVAAGVPVELLSRRPDVREAERAAASQSAQIGVSEAEFYPHISLIGSLDYQSQNLDTLLSPGSLQGNIGPSYSWNILNYRRLLNNVRAQDALFQQLVARYQNTVLTAAGEVESGLVTFLKSQEQARLQSDAVNAAKKAVDLALIQYREGRVDFNRVAVLQQTLVQQQNLLAQARGQVATGLINVYRALGGGWQIRLDPECNNFEIDHIHNFQYEEPVTDETIPSPAEHPADALPDQIIKQRED